MYYRTELEKYSIHDLREIGKAIGVDKPTTKKKCDLITDILAVQTGKIAPTFTNLGRPRLKALTNITIQERVPPVEPVKKVDPIEEEIDKVLEPIKDLLMRLLKNQNKSK